MWHSQQQAPTAILDQSAPLKSLDDHSYMNDTGRVQENSYPTFQPKLQTNKIMSK